MGEGARRLIATGTVAGLAVPPLLVAVFVGLTVVERSFLRSVGWSAVHRTVVEWPSLLALGSQGWILVAALVAAGTLGVAFAAAIHALLPRRARGVAWLLGLMSVATALEAFRPDSPLDRGSSSWNDTIHNGAYPLIPLCAVGAASILAVALRAEPGWKLVARVSVAALVVMAFGLALSTARPIAQLGRYAFFGGLLAWLEALAVVAYARGRELMSRPSAM